MSKITLNIQTGQIEVDDEFVAPSFETSSSQEVTETQFIRACVRLGLVTADEGEGYLARGELPAMMTGVLAILPEPQRTDARLKAVGASKFSRDDDVFTAMVMAGVYTNEQIDAVFRLAASL